MNTLVVAIASFLGFILAYRTYGRWLGRKIFRLRGDVPTPAEQFRDGSDYVPSRRSVVFGHHFTSIAGTGPIVGPAIAVFWGWLPALLWVVFGSIFIGAVHDFGALVVSLRNRGQSIGEIAGRVIHPRARLLLLAVLLLELTIVLAVFGLVIAIIFATYPESVPAVWISLPMAIAVGLLVHRRKGSLLLPSLLALVGIYAMVYVGTQWPIDVPAVLGLENPGNPYLTPVVLWTMILFVYCFIASVLPVWVLLQPRDYVNANQLFLAMALLIVGLLFAAGTGQADLFASAPAVASSSDIPQDAPPMLPFLFIIVACGAVSGFHSLVSSGTSSKQLSRETDALPVGYGSMLTEGALAVIVILACCAGVGMGQLDRAPLAGGGYSYSVRTGADGQALTGRAAWRTQYALEETPDPETGVMRKLGWSRHKLPDKIAAFVEGGGNFLHTIGVPLKFAVGLLAVLVACFAATTLDTATRLQRYVVQEIGRTVRAPAIENKYVATTVAVAAGLSLAIFAGPTPGAGGMILWPMFGATNQLLAGLGFLVIGFFLIRRGRSYWFLVPPAVLMIGLPAWAMGLSMADWYAQGKWLLLGFGAAMQLLTAWLIVEAVLAWRGACDESAGEAVPGEAD